MTDVYIISGFLGSGKTTLIQNLLSEVPQHQKVVIIENDFGEINFDAALLKQGGYQVKELNAGCICCSINENFEKSLVDIIRTYQPDKIIIEPSGVSKLSDVEKACKQAQKVEPLRIAHKITVVDRNHLDTYLENFGEFFEDQVKYADCILISKTEHQTEKTEQVKNKLKQYNQHAAMYIDSLDKIDFEQLQKGQTPVCTCQNHNQTDGGEHSHTDCCENGNHHNHQHHEHHIANDAFDTFTLKFQGNVNVDKLQEILQSMESFSEIQILRAKGIIKNDQQYLKVQYVPGQLDVEETDADGNYICIIGSNLSKNNIKKAIESMIK